MSLRYELDPKYIFQYQKEFNLNAMTIISPKIRIKFSDLNFTHFKFKTIHSFRILLLTQKLDIIKFDTLTEDWFWDFTVKENIQIKIQIEYSWKRHKDKIHIMDWEEWILEKN